MNSIRIEPSDNLFVELGRNNYDFRDLISELIDNSIAARLDGQDLDVSVSIYVDHGMAKRFVISDNASGISTADLGVALSPGALQTSGSLNEHGMGLKQAIAALGTLEYLTTKTMEDSKAKQITELRFGDVPVKEINDFSLQHGTEVSINNLNAVVKASHQSISHGLTEWLGARYRYFLRPESKILNLDIRLKDMSGRDTNVWQINEVKPIYFHIGSRHNEPVINSYKLGNSRWSATLTFGYAPTESSEYEELGIDEVPTRYHPYYVSFSNQGLDILLHDRVIKFHQLSEVGIVDSRHPDYNNVRGEIRLDKGFRTAITKNSIIDDDNFQELIREVREILHGQKPGPQGKTKNYLKGNSYPDQLPEKLLRDRLINWLKANTIAPRTNVRKEFAVQGIDGYADIIADDEVWELKVEQASSKDVYQLFMYMDIGENEAGYLVAKSFTSGARVAVDEVNRRHNKNIALTELSTLPINHPPTEDERNAYY